MTIIWLVYVSSHLTRRSNRIGSVQDDKESIGEKTVKIQKHLHRKWEHRLIFKENLNMLRSKSNVIGRL